MTTDTDTIASPAADIRPAPVASNGSISRKAARWPKRRYQVGGGLIALAILAGVIANAFVGRQFTADGAVRQYLSALQSGDVNSAWNAIQVSASTQPVAASMTNQGALQAALSTSKPDVRNFAISGDTQVDSATTMVAFTYDTSAGSKQAKVVVQRSGQTHFGIYPVWRLVITPTLLDMTLPKGSNGVTIDGQAISLAGGAKSSVAVLPLAHKVEFNGTQMLASETLAVDALFSVGQTVSFQPELTPAGVDKATAAIKVAFEACAQRTSANLDAGACPQGLSTYVTTSGRWQFVGDPTQDLAFGFDKDLNVAGIGHFQATFSYQGASQGIQRVPSSGAYSAALALAPTDVTVASIQSTTGLPALARPAGATDQAARDLVVHALKKCAAVRAESVANCPQFAPDVLTSNVRWRLTQDPISAASVSFDPTNGLFTIHGNFAMAVSYTWFGYPKSGHSLNTAYDARLFWDGQNYQLVTIDGASS